MEGTKMKVATNEGRVAVDVAIGLHRILHFRIHRLRYLRTVVGEVTIVNVIIADTNLQTMKVVAMIVGTTTGQGRRKEEVTMGIDRRVDVVRRHIRHHEGIATDMLGRVHLQCQNDLAPWNLHIFIDLRN